MRLPWIEGLLYCANAVVWIAFVAPSIIVIH